MTRKSGFSRHLLEGLWLTLGRRYPFKESHLKSSIRPLLSSSIFVWLALCINNPLQAGIVTVPVGLSPGATYQLVFATAGAWQSISGDIADYNALVATEGAGITGIITTWKVIGSTGSINASANAPVTANVYNLSGDMVATAAGFYTASHLAPINIGPLGEFVDGQVWTGSNTDGSASAYCLGSPSHGVIFGDTMSTGVKWSSWDRENMESQLHLYGLSGVLTVEDAGVPEPGSFGMLVVGGLALAGGRAFLKTRLGGRTN
jgi:hypothetical protein